jgi:dolichol-phosphate mannosyltransferase
MENFQGSKIVVIPTYNEVENITKLVNKLLEKNFYVLIVDDNSPDGTFNIIKNHKEFNLTLFGILRHGERGYRNAVVEGFDFALSKKYTTIIQMDADFSHSIEDLMKMEKFSDFSLVIGSRYVFGGKVLGWGFHRKVLSFTANKIAKFVVRTEVNDLTSGFRLYSNELLSKVDYRNIKSNGYSFLVELLFEILKEDVSIKEVPITFVNRVNGKSKMRFKIIFESSIKIFKLFLKNKN